MKINNTLAIFLLMVLAFASCTTRNSYPTSKVAIVPEPNNTTLNEGSFALHPKPSITIATKELQKEAQLVKQWLDGSIEKESKKGDVHLTLDPTITATEGYTIEITKQGVTITGKEANGVFYGLQTLRQLLPESIEKGTFEGCNLPFLTIDDAPRFSWRGMHLDVSRHFMPTEFVKKYIDYLALHKMNVFHWHLVDGVGWRIEIKKYPLLTDVGAWRVVKGTKPWIDYEVWREGDSRPKEGGFYSQDEIKEIVQYATDRHITVLPEIELPGHSEVVFQCYPEMLCQNRGKNLKNIGVYCAGNKKSYTFLENILDEVLELFPSEYIHIGGDEVSKSNWKKCDHCKRLLKEQKLKDTHEIQSYFVNHFEKYLSKKGRKLIGWHEIVEGNLTNNANIMYWGGDKEVKKILEHGHPTVLTTGSHYYFDHYQGTNDTEPDAWGGLSTLKDVYSYEPLSADLNQQEKELVLGVQANVWSEYMFTPKHVEYMVFPRMSAVAETAWTNKEKKDWNSYNQRLEHLWKRYQTMDIRVAQSAYIPTIVTNFDAEANVTLSIETELKAEIHYTLDGTAPTKTSIQYNGEPVKINTTSEVQAVAFINDTIAGPVRKQTVLLHKGAGAEVTLVSRTFKYDAKGGETIVDHEFGADKWGNGKWLGILDRDFEAILKLKQAEEINSVKLSCIEDQGSGIFFPTDVQVYGSNDGKNYQAIGKWSRPLPSKKDRSAPIKTQRYQAQCNGNTYQYLKIKATSLASAKKWHGVFLFIDEVVIE